MIKARQQDGSMYIWLRDEDQDRYQVSLSTDIIKIEPKTIIRGVYTLADAMMDGQFQEITDDKEYNLARQKLHI